MTPVETNEAIAGCHPALLNEGESAKPDFGMPVHEVCEFYPLIEGDALAKLALDIKTNGLLNPIVRHEGQLVDGRNRLLACRMAGVEPRFVAWKAIYHAEMTVGSWIHSVNSDRRHMTVDQLIATEVLFRGWEERDAAKQAQIEAGNRGKEGGRGHKKPFPSIDGEGFPNPKPKRSGAAAKIAEDLGVSERKVQQALNIQTDSPDLLKEVGQKKTSLHEAEKKAKASPAAEQRRVKVHRLDILHRNRILLLEEMRQFTRLITWLSEKHGDLDRAETLLQKATGSTAALSAEIARIAVEADPLNASRLGIEEKTA